MKTIFLSLLAIIGLGLAAPSAEARDHHRDHHDWHHRSHYVVRGYGGYYPRYYTSSPYYYGSGPYYAPPPVYYRPGIVVQHRRWGLFLGL